MKKILLSLAATAALATAAAPAAAQTWGGYDGRDDYRQSYGQDRSYAGRQNTTAYVDSLSWKIDNAVQQRRISWQEARQLKNELRQIQPLAWRVQTGQARRGEVQRLQWTVNRIESALNRYARDDRRHDRDDYSYGYGYGYRR